METKFLEEHLEPILNELNDRCSDALTKAYRAGIAASSERVTQWEKFGDLDQRIAEEIKVDCSGPDTERNHGSADEHIVMLLKRLGFDKTVDAYEAIEKWYA
jgi:hypothetical protein